MSDISSPVNISAKMYKESFNHQQHRFDKKTDRTS